MESYTTAEIAKQLGVTENEIIKLGIEEGIMNEYGEPTQKGYDMGLFVQPEFNKTHTVVMSKFNDETYLFSDIGIIMDKENFIIESKRLLSLGDEINLVRSISCFETLMDFEIFICESIS